MATMRGIYAIPPTPFKENLEINQAELRAIIEFIIASGAHGIVLPVYVSEFSSLSDEERKTVVEVASRQNNARLPLVVCVSGTTERIATEFAQHAESCGANALIAIPPYIHKADEAGVFRYYEAISNKVKLPIFIQNLAEAMGTPLSAAVMARMVAEIEMVDYIKEESVFSSHVMSEVMSLCERIKPGKLKGVMGGKGGRFLLDEYRREVCGTMPACEVADVHVQLWDLLEQGDQARAIELFQKLLELINMESVYGIPLIKQILKYRGIISSTKCRQNGLATLDELDELELERALGDLKPFFKL